MRYQLSKKQKMNYEQDGFLSPLKIFDGVEVKNLRESFEAFETRFGGIEKASRVRADIHLLQNWAWSVINDPRIVDRISSILGPNVLLWSTNWFIKEPGDSKVVSFHQDANYWGLEPHNVATAWLALSDAPPESGPMSFVSGSHLDALYDHDNTFAENNLLSRGQTISQTIDQDRCKLAPLHAGEMSIHHVRTIHNSGPNTSADRRIGMVLRYCATNVKQTKGPDTAVLVAGEDHFGHFDLLEGPKEDFGEKESSRHGDAIKKLGKIIMS